MTVKYISEKLELDVLCGDTDREVNGVYTGDLLSWVMSKLTADKVWITIMSNINVIAVASLADAACVILAEGVEPDPEALEAAKSKDVTLLSSPLDAYSLCVRISELTGESK
ncbi:MAG: AraC family transcriptional regulator [Ruminococcaceae bacterium]|nr:AraC family transcriptional regulator [Oscillospiraceae bacterium]